MSEEVNAVEESLQYIHLTANIISTIGSLVALIVFLIAKPLHFYSFKLVFVLNLFDLIRSLTQIFPMFFKHIPDVLCEISGFVHIFAVFQTNYWSFAIAVTMYQALVLNNIYIEKYFYYWISFGFTFPAAMCTTSAFLGLYGNIGHNCTLRLTSEGNIFRLIIIYIPGGLITFGSAFIFLRLYKILSINTADNLNREKIQAKRLFFYPLILLVCIWPQLVLRIMQMDHKSSLDLMYVSSILWGLQGFFNALAYTLTKPVKEYMKEFLCSKRHISVVGQELMDDKPIEF
ncbi:hypothetical protein SteCoe_14617 [Stentor coeruleus]|uniref:G-protein coupled receptors family 2 profile 2 domain-containing protein n=1 Tax=Stentor coeruleus TaxID=5963 RepID=A0A1R2C5I1_9CILI|nr:hypothetical protein SteCoe_14617 [Stentor coeruleus]